MTLPLPSPYVQVIECDRCHRHARRYRGKPPEEKGWRRFREVYVQGRGGIERTRFVHYCPDCDALEEMWQGLAASTAREYVPVESLPGFDRVPVLLRGLLASGPRRD